MTRVLYCAMLLSAGLPWQVVAQEECANAMSQAEITACSVIDYKNADEALNGTYKVIMPAITNPQREQLRNAQRAWIKFRDANCEHQAFDTRGGSIYQAVKNDCLTRVTLARVEELKRIYPGLFPKQMTASLNNVFNAPPVVQTNPVAEEVNTPEPKANGGKMDADVLLGRWENMAEGYDIRLQFNLVKGQNLYSSVLNGAPFEAGIWQLLDDQLLITTSTGEQLRLYSKVALQDNVLSLYEQDGSVEHYRRQP